MTEGEKKWKMSEVDRGKVQEGLENLKFREGVSAKINSLIEKISKKLGVETSVADRVLSKVMEGVEHQMNEVEESMTNDEFIGAVEFIIDNVDMVSFKEDVVGEDREYQNVEDQILIDSLDVEITQLVVQGLPPGSTIEHMDAMMDYYKEETHKIYGNKYDKMSDLEKHRAILRTIKMSLRGKKNS